MRTVILLAVAISLSACAGLAAQQAPRAELQQFVVLQSERLVTSFASLTNEQAQCAISGASNFATMRCQAPGGTAKASYHYVTALVVDRQGKGYVIACHESLLNVWCKRFTPGVAIQGSFSDGQQLLSVADGQKLHPYQTLTTANVGPLPSNPPAPPPSAKAAAPRAEPAARPGAPATASSSSNGSPAIESAGKAPSETSSGTCAAPATSCVNFVSEPPGADIYVDGKFAGNTPSSLALPAGSHEIRVEAGKFKPWTRTLASTAGSTVTIHATLAKK